MYFEYIIQILRYISAGQPRVRSTRVVCKVTPSNFCFIVNLYYMVWDDWTFNLFFNAIAFALNGFPRPGDELLYSLLEPTSRRHYYEGDNRILNFLVVRGIFALPSLFWGQETDENHRDCKADEINHLSSKFLDECRCIAGHMGTRVILLKSRTPLVDLPRRLFRIALRSFRRI